MAVLAIGVVGAVIGDSLIAGTVLGMSGAAIGWTAGVLIGNALFTPKQKTDASVIGDLRVSGSSYGSVIPWVAGHARVKGEIIWASDRRVAHETYGSGKSTQAITTYNVDLLMQVSDNIIAGVSRVWLNNKLVWVGLAGATGTSMQASIYNTEFARMTVYGGGPSQSPDATYVAAVGAANAPAYRGRGTVFLQGVQLHTSGEIPNFQFEVYTAATSNTPIVRFCTNMESPTPTQDISYYNNGVGYLNNSALIPNQWYSETIPRPAWVMPINQGAYHQWAWSNTTNFLRLSGETRTLEFLLKGDPGVDNPYYGSALAEFRISGSITCNLGATGPGSGINQLNFQTNPNHGSSISSMNLWDGNIHHIALTWKSTGVISVFADGVRVLENCTNADAGGGSFPYISIGGITNTYYPTARLKYYGVRLTAAELYTTATYTQPTYFDTDYPSVTLVDETLPNVVSNLCLRTGLVAGQIDVTALSAVTQPVRSLAVSQVSSARSVLDMLASTYFFDAVLSNKIYFRPRGGASAATLTFAELGVSADAYASDDPLPIIKASELEIPATVALTYPNVDGDYLSDTQTSDRLLTGQDSTNAVSVPIGFTASEAKKIVDSMVSSAATALTTTRFNVGLDYAKLEPTDIVTITADDGSVYRLFLSKKTEADGVLTFDAIVDDAAVLVQTGNTNASFAPSLVVNLAPITLLALPDIPILQDADNLPGHYLVVQGSAESWAGAGIYESLDATNYTGLQTMADQGLIGSCTTALTSWTGGNVMDATSTVTVNVGVGQCVGVTRTALLADPRLNLALVGNELLQYQSATLVSSGIYTLSNFLRGRRGTEGFMAAHTSTERFILLQGPGLRFIELALSELGAAHYYKAVTVGASLSGALAAAITPLGVGLKCLSPVDCRANRTSTDTELTWKRRTRLATRLVGALPILAPLGEASEAYEIDIYSSNTFITLKRTLTASTASATYTLAQQTTDFGAGQSVLYVKVYQLSATAGRGYALTATI